MELWIRSQDKTNLILAKDIVVSDGNIKVYKDTELCTTVAMYKTKKRALEVLDEIQEVLCPKVLIMKPNSQITISDNANLVLPNNCSYERIGDTYVYEMPEE